jgi:Tol biopolymer transport system component
VLVSHPNEIFAFLLLPNGRFIYSMTDQPGLFNGGNIWEIRADVHTGLARSKPRRLSDFADLEISGLSATADGKRLTLLKERTDLVSVYVGNLQGNGSRIVNLERLTLSDSFNHAYAWTPDNKAVLFDSNRNGTWDIFKQSLDQRTAMKLVASQGARHRPAMSPDGASVLYLTFNSAGYYSPSKIMRVALTGGPPLELGGIQNIGEIRCARTANLCVVGDYGPTQRVFYALDPTKGKGRELLRISQSFFPGGDMSWDLSPDGSSLVLLTNEAEKGRFQIKIRPLDGGPGREPTVDGWTNAENIRWAADGKGWYVTTSSIVAWFRRGDSTLLRVDLSGKAQQLMRGFAWADAIPSADGRHLAMMGWVPASNVWMLENF